MKKWLSIVLSFVFLISNVSVAFAADPVEKVPAVPSMDLKKAIEIVKQKIEIPDTGYDFNSNYFEDTLSKNWNLTWNSKPDQAYQNSYSVTLDADTKEITGYYYYNSKSYNQSRLPKYTKEEALKVATDFMTKLLPSKSKEIELQQFKINMDATYGYSADTYNFNFIRMINNIPYNDNVISVMVNKSTLEVSSLNMKWDKKPLDLVHKKIDLKKAKEIFKQRTGLELAYVQINPYDYNSELKTKLVYRLKKPNSSIDAVTGEIIENANVFAGNYSYQAMGEKALSSRASVTDIKLSPEEKNEIYKNEKLIKKEKALSIAKKIAEIDKTYTLTSSNLNAGYPKGTNPAWSFYWSYQQTSTSKNTKVIPRSSSKSCSIDAVTGEIVSFYDYNSKYDQQQGKKQKYDKIASKTIAEKYIKTLAAKKFKQCNLDESTTDYVYEGSPTQYVFNYVRNEKGIVYPFNNISVTVNPYVGKVVSYYMNWYQAKTEKPKTTISIEDAYKNLFDGLGFSLKYYNTSNNYTSVKKDAKVKLVYSLDNPITFFVDAQTGKIIDTAGNTLNENSDAGFTDIKDNKAETAIKALLTAGVIIKDSEKFLPDEKIKQRDFIEMLVRMLEPYISGISTEDIYYQSAIQRNILTADEKNPEALVTKLEAAKYLIRAMKLEYVAKINDIFAAGADDIKDPIDKGYISILDGLKIISASKKKFEPETQVTRGDTAIMIYNLLQSEYKPN